MTQDYASLKAQGDAALKDENFELASTCFQQALALAPNNPESYNNLGYLYYYQGQSEQAEQSYLKAIALDPLFPKAVYNLGAFYWWRNQYELCVEWLHKAIELGTEKISAYRYIGEAYEFLGDQANAEKYYQQGLERDPEHLYLQYGLARKLFDRQENDAAYEILIKLEDKAPPEWRAQIYYYLGIIYFNRRQYALCIEWMQKAIDLTSLAELTEILPNAFWYLGEASFTLGNHACSEEFYRKGLELDPEDSYLQLGLACRLGYRYDDDAAYEILIKLVDTATPNLLPDVYHYLGVACKSKKDFETAIEYLNKAISLTDEPSDSYRRLAEIYASSDTPEGYEKAIQTFKIAMEKGTATSLDYYQLGRLYFFLDNFELSIQHLNDALEIEEDQHTYYHLARAYFVNNDYLKSIESIKKAISIDSNNPKYYVILSFSYYRLDDFEATLESFMQALDLEGFASENMRGDYEVIASLLREKGSHEHLIPLFMAAHERVEAKFGRQDSP